METQKQKTAIIIVMTMVILVVVIVIICAVSEKKEPKKIINQFAKCEVLFDSCKDQDCNLLFLCNETEFSDCQVYDCGDNYGVRIIDKAGNIQEKVREKTSPCENKETQEMIAKCSGTFEVVEKNNCESGKAIAKVKLNVKGDCKIVSATMAINDKTRIASVERDGEFYNLSVKSCGEISDIKIAGEGGVGIREKAEIDEALPKEMLEERLLPHEPEM